MSKQTRQKELETIILRENKGWRQADLARRLGVHRSTVGRDIQEMSKKVPLVEKAGLIYIDSKSYETSIQMNIHEMLSLHLASRYLQKNHQSSPYFSSVLKKVSESLSSHSEFVSQCIEENVHQIREEEKEWGRKLGRLQEKLNLAWIDGKVVHLKYQNSQKGLENLKGVICYIESATTDEGAHILFKADNEERVRDLLMDNIQQIRQSNEYIQQSRDWLKEDVVETEKVLCSTF